MAYGATGKLDRNVPSLHVQIATPEPSHYVHENGENSNGYGFSGFNDDMDDAMDDLEDIGGESYAQTHAFPTCSSGD